MTVKLPNNVTFHGQQYGEQKAKLDEQLRQVNMNFKKLRYFYTKINETCDQIELPLDQVSGHKVFLCLYLTLDHSLSFLEDSEKLYFSA